MYEHPVYIIAKGSDSPEWFVYVADGHDIGTWIPNLQVATPEKNTQGAANKLCRELNESEIEPD
jgi:hypothetical protein